MPQAGSENGPELGLASVHASVPTVSEDAGYANPATGVKNGGSHLEAAARLRGGAPSGHCGRRYPSMRYAPIQSPSGTASKHFAFANRQVIDHVKDENVIAVEIIRTVAQSWSNGIHATEIITEVVSVRERVIRLELQAAREAVVQPRLQRLVVAAGIVAEEVAHNAGAAAGQCFTRGIGEAWITKFVEEWTTQIGRRIRQLGVELG